MKNRLRLKTLVATAVVALLPSIANANLITFSGTVSDGNTATHGFAVLTGGELRFSTLNDFIFTLFNSTGDSISGLIAGSFTDTLAPGNYSVGITNLFGALTDSYVITINNTIRSPAVVAATSVPEPTTISMLGAGLLGMAWLRRRRPTA
jgi:hypothetical protein